MGTNPKGYFLNGMGGRSLVVFQGRNMGFFKFSKELFFWWCGMGCLEKVDGYVFFFFLVFFPFVIW
jgi:hypothetical protein